MNLIISKLKAKNIRGYMIAKYLFTPQEIRQNLLGCLEIALFMPKGADRFAADKQAMKRSFLIPLLFLPISVAIVLCAHPAALDTGSMQVIGAIYALRMFVYLGAFLALIFTMTKFLNESPEDHREDFYKFATANNWLMIPAAVLMAPLAISFLSGNHEWGDIYPLMVFIALYAYAYTAFMAARVLRIPMELAVFVSVAGMAIHQTSLDVIKQVTVGVLQMMA